jgi:hypothetical protein
MSDVLHQKYITDENGDQTDVILDLSEFTQLLQAASLGSERFKSALDELIASNPRLRELLEDIEDQEAFARAKRAPDDDQAAIPFDTATAEIEHARQ